MEGTLKLSLAFGTRHKVRYILIDKEQPSTSSIARSQNKRSVVVATDDTETQPYFSILMEDPEDGDQLRHTLTKIINWKKEFLIGSLPEIISPIVKELVAKNGGRVERETHCVVMEWNKSSREVLDNYSKKTCKLEEEHATTIDENWKFRYDGSEDFLRRQLRCGLGFGCFVDHEGSSRLVSWAIAYPDASIGMLYTVEEYRGRGHAKAVISAITLCLADLGIRPYAHIEPSNEVSQKLFQDLGYTKSFSISWIKHTPLCHC